MRVSIESNEVMKKQKVQNEDFKRVEWSPEKAKNPK
jgi:hypothetical protein